MTLDPTTLTGKRRWFRGKDLGSVGATITGWTDQSGNSGNATVSSGTPKVGASLGISAATDNTHYGPSGGDGGASFSIDGNSTTYWTTNGVAAGWARYQLPAASVCVEYKIRRRDDIPGRNPKTWTFEGSNDGTTFTTLDTQTNIAWSTAGETKAFAFTNSTAYLYYRLNITANNGDTYTSVTDITLTGTDKSLSTLGAVVALPADSAGGTTRELWVVARAGSPTGGGGEAAWVLGSSGQATVFPYSDGKIYDGSYTTTRQSFTPGLSMLNTKRIYRLTMTGGVWTAYLDGVQQFTASGLTFGLATAPKLTNGWTYGDIYEVFERSTISTSDEVSWLIDYFNKEHGLAVAGGVDPSSGTTVAAPVNVGLGFVATPVVTTTMGAPVSAGLGFAAKTVLTTTLGMAASVGLAFTATAIPRTTVEAPVTAGISFAASTVEAGTTDLAMPVTVGASFTAATVESVTSTVAAPVSVGLAFDAHAVVSTTLAASATVGLSFEATKQEPTTLTMPVTVGLEFLARVGGTTTLDMPVTAELGFTATGGDTNASAWTADLSQRTLMPFVGSGSATFTPPLAAMPVMIVERPITRASVIVPDLTTVSGARVHPTTGQIAIPDNIYDAFPVTSGTVGVPHIIIDGRDVTYFRDARTLVTNDRAQEPFGDAQLTVDFPQITTLDDKDDVDLTWLRVDATVHFVMQVWDADGPTGVVETLFHGRLVSDDSGNDDTSPQKTWTARGDMWSAASFTHLPRLMMNPVDLGTQIPKTLNAVTSRRFAKIPAVTTGIKTLQRGNRGEKVMEYVQGLLGDAWTDAGRQWTVAKKPGSMNRYQMRLKKNGVDWTVTNGMRGLAVSLSSDSTQSRNVIWGSGQRSDGGVWMNKKFPDAGRTAPAYPFSSAGSVMSIGTTDGMTTADGVSTWQRRAKALGFRITVDGVFSSADADVARALQRQYGILVDGIVGPQTWAESFDVGALGADPDQWVRLPLAWLPGTQPFRYRANGSLIGPDPAYDPSITIVSDDIDMGTDVSLADGKRSAQQIIDRENPPSLSGSLTLTTDPREGSRFSIQPGDRVKVIGYEGRDVVLHIADRDRAWTGKGPVTLQVAETAYDALTLAQIRQRNNANRADTARRPGKVRTKPVIDPWDCESNAGQIERHALYGGLWTVIRIPMSEVGRIAELNLHTSPATRFSFFIFAKPITSAEMIRYVGSNPLALDNPGEANRELLEDRFGWIQGWGRKGDALGYYPGSEGTKHALTGRAKESGEDYWSPSGYLYLAEYAAGSTFIEGDMRATPPEA